MGRVIGILVVGSLVVGVIAWLRATDWGKPADPVTFNDKLVSSNKVLEAAGKKFGEAVRSGTPRDVDATYANLQATLKNVREETKALEVPLGRSARALYDAEQTFLDGQERIIQKDFAEIVQIVKKHDMTDQKTHIRDRQREIKPILARAAKQEQADLAPLQEAWRAFAAEHNITLE
jgi:hypothetical protein